jgi:hypothetical protein
MINELTFYQGFILGSLIGFLLGVAAMIFFGRKGYRKEDLLAWTIGIVWLTWHVAAGFTGVIHTPPSMFDIVSGGAIGFIFGEKFFDYIAGAVSRTIKNK